MAITFFGVSLFMTLLRWVHDQITSIKAFTQCRCNAGPPSVTVAQHYSGIGWCDWYDMCLLLEGSHRMTSGSGFSRWNMSSHHSPLHWSYQSHVPGHYHRIRPNNATYMFHLTGRNRTTCLPLSQNKAKQRYISAPPGVDGSFRSFVAGNSNVPGSNP